MYVMIVFVSISIGVLIHSLSFYLEQKLAKRSASYKLNAVRDDLAVLVAKGKLEKEGKIFQYYHRQIKALLKLVPDVGLDDAMAAFLLLRKNKDFDRSLSEAVEQAEEMLELVEKEGNEVSDVIADYYAASKNLMLVHSNGLRLLYLVVVKYQLPDFVKNLIPDAIRAGIRTVMFADSEEARFRQVTHQAQTA